MNDMITLRRYFLWANQMRISFYSALDDFLLQGGEFTNMNEEETTKFFSGDLGMFMSYWYAGLFVVVEGWSELNLHDPEIDIFLDSPNVDFLRRYRNGVFHFQREYFDNRFFDFFQESERGSWIHILTESLGRFFSQNPLLKSSNNDTLSPKK